MTEDITKIVDNVNINSYSRTLCEYIKYSNCLMQAMETRKRLNYKDYGMCKLLNEHMEKMANNIYNDGLKIKLKDFKMMDLDREMRRVRYGISEKLKKCSPENVDKLICKYFDKALKSGRRMNEFSNALENTGTEYENSIQKILEQYTKIKKI